MKKTLFAILAVLFTIALIATCDVFEEPLAANDDLPKTTPDGRPLVLVTLNIDGLDIGDFNEGNSRALTLDSAKTLVEDFDVVFMDLTDNSQFYGTHFTRTTPGGSATTQISVPTGDYNSAGKAVVFAGTNNTLLAVGKITMVDSTPNTSSITGSCSVTFTLTALRNEGTEGTGFKIAGPTSQSGYTTATTDVTISGDVYKVYDIMKPGFNNADTTATNTSGNVVGQFTFGWGNIGSNNSDGVFIHTAWTAISSTPTITPPGGGTVATFLIQGLNPNTTTGMKLSSSGSIFSFNIKPPDTGTNNNVYSQVYINVPVKPISGSNNTIGTGWFIRGGVDYNNLESSANTRGGAVLLHSEYLMVPVGIIVNPGDSN